MDPRRLQLLAKLDRLARQDQEAFEVVIALLRLLAERPTSKLGSAHENR